MPAKLLKGDKRFRRNIIVPKTARHIEAEQERKARTTNRVPLSKEQESQLQLARQLLHDIARFDKIARDPNEYPDRRTNAKQLRAKARDEYDKLIEKMDF